MHVFVWNVHAALKIKEGSQAVRNMVKQRCKTDY